MTVPDNMQHIVDYVRNPKWPKNIEKFEWGFRLNKVDLASSHGYVWPASGWAHAPGPILPHQSDCCHSIGDGVGVALTLAGARSAGADLDGSGLFVGWKTSDLLGKSTHKVRVKRAWVVGLFDPILALVLSRADLSRSDLHYVRLRYANLSGVNLGGVNLMKADLTGADLTGANLIEANLSHTRLDGANLTGANLTGAVLYGAMGNKETIPPYGYKLNQSGLIVKN